MQKQIQVTSNYLYIAYAYNNRKRYTNGTEQGKYSLISLEGSSRSGKSWSIAQFIAELLEKYSNKTFTIARDSRASLTDTTYHTLRKVFNEYGFPTNHFNKTATDIYINNNIIRFVGCNDDPMRAHGLEQDYLWLNEAISINKNTRNQMLQRTSEFAFFDYNPSEYENDIYNLEKQDNVCFIKSTFLDNPLAPQAMIKQILSYAAVSCHDGDLWKQIAYYLPEIKSELDWIRFKQKNEYQGTADAWMWEVYGKGLRTAGDDRIFKKYELFDDLPPASQIDNILYGGDFGYYPAPSTFIQCVYSGNSVYLTEIMYETYSNNEDIAEHCKDYHEEIQIWDSASPKDITALRRLEMNAYPADKSAGVEFGIKKMLSRNIFVNAKSTNLLRELKSYRWKKDTKGNYVVNSHGHRVPIKKDDHCLDAWRYAETFYN